MNISCVHNDVSPLEAKSQLTVGIQTQVVSGNSRAGFSYFSEISRIISHRFDGQLFQTISVNIKCVKV